jgi:hypothetical protein
MLRNRAAILFVSFDMTACDARGGHIDFDWEGVITK